MNSDDDDDDDDDEYDVFYHELQSEAGGMYFLLWFYSDWRLQPSPLVFLPDLRRTGGNTACRMTFCLF